MGEIYRMALRKKKVSPSLLSQVLKTVGDKLRGPLAVILGTPGEVFPFLAALPRMAVTCYEMDLYPAQRLREELAAIGLEAEVVAAADLWDLPAEFQTVVYPAPKGGERELKIDMVEQAYHVLRPRGTFIVATPFQSDQFFPRLLKKTFGRVHMPNTGDSNSILWCTRGVIGRAAGMRSPFRCVGRRGIPRSGSFRDLVYSPMDGWMKVREPFLKPSFSIRVKTCSTWVAAAAPTA